MLSGQWFHSRNQFLDTCVAPLENVSPWPSPRERAYTVAEECSSTCMLRAASCRRIPPREVPPAPFFQEDVQLHSLVT